MSWFPILAAMAIAAVTVFGVTHPARAFTFLFSIAAALVIWAGREGLKVLKSAPEKSRVTRDGAHLT